MKIAQIVCVFPPYGGGIGNVAANLSLHLANLGHEVTVFTPEYNRLEDDFDQTRPYQVRRLPAMIKFGNAALIPSLTKKLNQFDIIDLHLPFLGSAGLVALYKRLHWKKTKLIIHYHMDLIGKDLIYESIFAVQHHLFTVPELLWADKIIVSSHDYLINSNIKSIYRKYPKKFTVIPFGVDTKLFYPMSKDGKLTKEYELQNKKVIMFVGGLDDAHYFKGVDYLIKACAILIKKGKDIRLLIVGKGNLVSSYKNLTKTLGIEDKVVFTGFVNDKDLPQYYNLADVFVLPSISESEAFGIVLLEAMACAKPVIASDLPGVREVVGQGKTGLLAKPKNEKDLSEKISTLLSDEDLYVRMSRDALLAVKNEYDWNKVAASTVAVYREALS